AEADVIVAPLGLEPQPASGAAGPAVVGPGAAPADARMVARPVPLRRGLRRVQVGVDAAGEPGVIPVAAPLEGVAVHVVQAPGVGRVAADLGRAPQRWPRLGAVIRLPFEVRLLAAELVAERGGGRRAGAAGVFPLRLGGQPELPVLREVARPAAELGELP